MLIGSSSMNLKGVNPYANGAMINIIKDFEDLLANNKYVSLKIA